MYRAVTLAAMRSEIDLTNEQQLLDLRRKTDFQFTIAPNLMKVAVNGQDATEDIRLPEVTANVRYIASAPQLRKELVEMQRNFAKKHHRIVTEGRDQGTVAFPDADFKFFLTAELTERARRRQNQLIENGRKLPAENIRDEIEKRDTSDKSRAVGPLAPADDAVIIDTTDLDARSVVEKLLTFIRNK